MKIERIEKTNLQFGNEQNSSKNGKDSGRKNKDEFEKNFKDYIIDKNTDISEENQIKTQSKSIQETYKEMIDRTKLEQTRVQIKMKNIER